MSTKKTRRRVIQSAVAVGAAGLMFAATAMPAAATSTKPVEDVIPALAAPQTVADTAPSTINLDVLGVEAADLRSLGSDDVADYWVARSGNEDVCLIAYIRGGNEVASSACVSIADFYRTGVGILTGESRDDPSRATEAYLFPADVDAGAVTQSGDARRSATTGSQFIASRPGDIDFAPTTLTRADGSAFAFSPIRGR